MDQSCFRAIPRRRQGSTKSRKPAAHYTKFISFFYYFSHTMDLPYKVIIPYRQRRSIRFCLQTHLQE